MWELKTKSFHALEPVQYPPLNGPSRTFTSMLIATSVTKSPGIVEKFLPPKLALVT